MIGDVVDPAVHLLAAANHSAAWQRLEELLFQPVAACQKKLRDLSRLTTTARLDHLQFGRLADHTDAIIELTKPEMYHDPGIASPPIYPERHVGAFRTPTFFLRAPDEVAWARAQSEILDACALVWDSGMVLGPVRDGGAFDGMAGLAKELIAAATGCDRFVERGKQAGPGTLDAIKVNLFVSTGRDVITDALVNGTPDVQRLLQNCVFTLPTSEPCPINLKPEFVRAGYEGYVSAVEKVLGTRRNGGGLRLAFKAELSEQIEQSAASTRNWCGVLPPKLQPFFARMGSLPHRLAWACLASLCPGESDRWVAPFVRATVRHVLTMQKEFLEEQMLAAEVAKEQRAREIMLHKLAASGPCLVRELMRRYANQRRALHQPVLDALINEGQIRRREDGRLELATVAAGS